MDKKAIWDKQRKSTLSFKTQRSILHKRKVNQDLQKQASEGNTYKTNIGLNLDPSSTQKSVQVLSIENTAISSDQLKKYEACILE